MRAMLIPVLCFVLFSLPIFAQEDPLQQFEMLSSDQLARALVDYLVVDEADLTKGLGWRFRSDKDGVFRPLANLPTLENYNGGEITAYVSQALADYDSFRRQSTTSWIFIGIGAVTSLIGLAVVEDDTVAGNILVGGGGVSAVGGLVAFYTSFGHLRDSVTNHTAAIASYNTALRRYYEEHK